MGHVKDIGGDFNAMNARAGYQSRARLPFHTDLGADLVGLLCLKPAKSGGQSSVTSAMALHNAMLEQRPDLLRLLAEPIHRDRRGEYIEGKAPTYLVRETSGPEHEKEFLVAAMIGSEELAQGRLRELEACRPRLLDAVEDVARQQR